MLVPRHDRMTLSMQLILLCGRRFRQSVHEKWHMPPLRPAPSEEGTTAFLTSPGDAANLLRKCCAHWHLAAPWVASDRIALPLPGAWHSWWFLGKKSSKNSGRSPCQRFGCRYPCAPAAALLPSRRGSLLRPLDTRSLARMAGSHFRNPGWHVQTAAPANDLSTGQTDWPVRGCWAPAWLRSTKGKHS